MSRLACLLRDHQQALVEHYGHRFSTQHHRAIQAITQCHTPECGRLLSECNQCHFLKEQCRSCGHRSCPECQYTTQQQWLSRQLQKQLPVTYFMVTFTLPAQLRGFAFAHPQLTYNWLFQCATDTLKTFSANDPKLGDAIGMTGVLHTHTRKLDYHPHVHFVLPGGGYDVRHRSWLCKKDHYFLNGKALARVFRGKFLAAMSAAGFIVPKGKLPWVAQAKAVGRGEKALQYLSRYLYRGVIADKNIVNITPDQVTFRYQDSGTRTIKRQTLPVLEFLWKVLQHVLPKGFRRARDYGFLNGNAKKLHAQVRQALNAPVPTPEPVGDFGYCCPQCGHRSRTLRFRVARMTFLLHQSTN